MMKKAMKKSDQPYDEEVVDQLMNLGYRRGDIMRASSPPGLDFTNPTEVVNKLIDADLVLQDDDDDTIIYFLNQNDEKIKNKIHQETDEEIEEETQPRPNNKMKTFMRDLEELIGILQMRLDFMTKQDSIVDILIAVEEKTPNDSLKIAKQKSLATERGLLE